MTTRSDVQARGAAIRKEAGAAGSRFDQRAQIVDTADGTLATKRSLLKDSGKQVAEDAETSVDGATDAVRNLLKKRK
jgi:conjugal transfer mating pair stabilization protein TraG